MARAFSPALSAHELGKLLVTNGAIPLEEVRDIQLLIPVDGVLTLRVDMNVTGPLLDKIIAAMQEVSDVNKRRIEAQSDTRW